MKLPVAVLLWLLVAEQFTVVVPRAKVEPDAGAHTGVIAPSLESVAVAVKFTTAPLGLVASAVISAGSVSTGGADGAGSVKYATGIS